MGLIKFMQLNLNKDTSFSSDGLSVSLMSFRLGALRRVARLAPPAVDFADSLLVYLAGIYVAFYLSSKEAASSMSNESKAADLPRGPGWKSGQSLGRC